MLRMFTRFRIAAFLMIPVLVAASAAPVAAQGPRETVASHHSFTETVAGLKGAVGKGGMMVMAEVDQGNIMSMTGLKMQGHLFLVGNPAVGKQVFGSDPGAGLYLPLRVYVYQDKDGTTFVSYDRPSAVLGQFHDPAIDKTAGMLDAKVGNLVAMVTK